MESLKHSDVHAKTIRIVQEGRRRESCLLVVATGHKEGVGKHEAQKQRSIKRTRKAASRSVRVRSRLS